MKIFHTADWHLGKLVQGVYMTEDQEYILRQFVQAVEKEKPDAVIVAGDLYDRAVPPTEAVHLLDDIFGYIVLDLKIPVLAIAGNHDSPSRVDFGSQVMKRNGLYIVGQLTQECEPVVLRDAHGEVHFHLVPFCDPSVIRTMFDDGTVRTHQDAAKKTVDTIVSNMDPSARHVFVGHSFVTPHGKEEENTSDSERPLSIGGTEQIDASLFAPFHYTALGHLHQAHYVGNESIRYAGSILKYSISEEHHRKGFISLEIDAAGDVTTEKRPFAPIRDMRTVEGEMEELLEHSKNEDYVFIRLTDEAPVLSPMEKVRSVYPNAMHVERSNYSLSPGKAENNSSSDRTKMSDMELFKAFYKEVKGSFPPEQTKALFQEVLEERLLDANETNQRESKKVIHE